MAGRYKFTVGQRVRPSFKGIKSNIFMPKYWEAGGVITRISKDTNNISVRWDHRRTAATYEQSFIEPDWRERKP